MIRMTRQEVLPGTPVPTKKNEDGSCNCVVALPPRTAGMAAQRRNHEWVQPPPVRSEAQRSKIKVTLRRTGLAEEVAHPSADWMERRDRSKDRKEERGQSKHRVSTATVTTHRKRGREGNGER